jgi:ParB family chromosome partitioning protein
VADYPGQIVADLFGEDGYFVDADPFWTAQYAAIDARRAAYLAAGWSDVVIVPPGEHFHTWEYEKAQKRTGGRVYIDVRASGEVSFHEGYVTAKEAHRRAKGEPLGPGQKPARPEVTSTMQTYIDLHRHAAVRAALTAHPAVALRLMVAHTIAGSPLWHVRPEPQSTRNEAVRESVETCRGEAEFDAKRRAVLDRLGFSAEEPTVTGGNGDACGLSALFLRLLALSDAAVMDVIAIVMGETLASGSAAVEAIGLEIGIDMARYWQADEAFFALIRDKEILIRIVADVAGETVAGAHVGEKTKVLKAIVRDCLDGANGRAKIEGWVPRWMAFPPSSYTDRGGVGTVAAHALLEAARRRDDEPASTGRAGAIAEPAPEAPPEAVSLAA